MAYTKNTWTNGDVVTSEKLNHMEDGIEGAGGVMVINDTNGTLDKTWQEIYDAMAQGKLCVIRTDYGNPEDGILASTVSGVYVNGGTYVITSSSHAQYNASSATGYPEIDANIS